MQIKVSQNGWGFTIPSMLMFCIYYYVVFFPLKEHIS